MSIAREPVPSPCVNVCVLDASGRTCMACRRTVDEIVSWGRMDEAERRAVVQRLRADD